MALPLTGDEALAQIAALNAAGASPDNCSYEQAIRGLYQTGERLRHAMAVSEHCKNVIAQTAACPAYNMEVTCPLTGQHLNVAVPIGTVVRASSPDEETATKILQSFLSLPMTWATREYAACLKDYRKYLNAAETPSQ